jgi:hypothetical protein
MRDGLSLLLRLAILHVSRLGPASDRAPPRAEVKSCPPGSRRRLARPGSRSPLPRQVMAPSSFLSAFRMCRGRTSHEAYCSRPPPADQEVEEPR